MLCYIVLLHYGAFSTPRTVSTASLAREREAMSRLPKIGPRMHPLCGSVVHKERTGLTHQQYLHLL